AVLGMQRPPLQADPFPDRPVRRDAGNELVLQEGPRYAELNATRHDVVTNDEFAQVDVEPHGLVRWTRREGPVGRGRWRKVGHEPQSPRHVIRWSVISTRSPGVGRRYRRTHLPLRARGGRL